VREIGWRRNREKGIEGGIFICLMYFSRGRPEKEEKEGIHGLTETTKTYKQKRVSIRRKKGRGRDRKRTEPHVPTREERGCRSP